MLVKSTVELAKSTNFYKLPNQCKQQLSQVHMRQAERADPPPDPFGLLKQKHNDGSDAY